MTGEPSRNPAAATNSPLKVKICGITRPEDACLAIDLGAWALGLMFYPKSSRVLSLSQARQLIARVQELRPEHSCNWVGVFVNQPVSDINRYAEELSLSYVQLHGEETLADIAALSVPCIKAFRTAEGFDPDSIAPYRAACPLLLVDSYSKGAYGGTGKAANWPMAKSISAKGPTLLAGGIHSGNALEALAAVQPAGLDLSSGVESAPGIKDHEKMRQLFAALATGAKR